MLTVLLGVAMAASQAQPSPKSPYSFKGLGDLPEGATDSRAYAVSADGKTVVGTGNGKFGREGFVWTKKTGMRSIGKLKPVDSYSEARAVSEDGKVVVGFSRGIYGQVAVRWSEAEGLVDLGRPTGTGETEAVGVTPDGVTVIGNSVVPARALSYRLNGYEWNNGLRTLVGRPAAVVTLPMGALTGWIRTGAEFERVYGGPERFEFSIQRGSPYLEDCWADYSVDGTDVKGRIDFKGWYRLIGCRTLGDVRLTAVSANASRYCGTVDVHWRTPETWGPDDSLKPMVRESAGDKIAGFCQIGNQTVYLATGPVNSMLVLPPPLARPTAINRSGTVVVGYLGDEKFAIATIWGVTGDGSVAHAGSFRGTEVLTTAQKIEEADTNAKSYGWAVSDSGDVVVGDWYALGNQPKAFAMSRNCRVHIGIQDLLQRHCPKEIEGWTLVSARGISADGRTVVGWGVNPAGKTEAWIATIGDVNVSKEELFGKPDGKEEPE